VVHHDLQVLAVRQLNKFFRLGSGASKRLLHENVFAVFQRSLRKLVVGPDRRHHRDHIDIGRSNQFVAAIRHPHIRIRLQHAL
jgi:hypothetical protein